MCSCITFPSFTFIYILFRWGDIKLKVSADGTEFLELNERQTKTRTGENLCDARRVTPKMFACPGPRDPVEIYKFYSEKRPADMSGIDDPFYLAPRTVPILEDDIDCVWFKKQKVGMRKLGQILKCMAENAGLNGSKNLTNHSARKHLVQKLRDSDIPPTEIMQISGHKNLQSILNYSRISESKQKQCSNLLSTVSSSQNSANPSNDGPIETVPLGANQSSSLLCTERPALSSVVHKPHEVSRMDVNIQQADVSATQFSTHQFAMTSMTNSYGSMFYGATFNVQQLNVYAQGSSAQNNSS